jgi:hypothetical protein
MEVARTVCLLTLVAFFAFAGAASNAQTELPQMAAPEARAAKWLALVDTQNYGASWDEAASAFRSRVTREQWSQAARMARTPFGELQRRTLKSATPATSLPGAPDGRYVVMQFDSAFEHKAAAVETLTMALDTDHQWRSVGYFIR